LMHGPPEVAVLHQKPAPDIPLYTIADRQHNLSIP
jgi:hypothetical protein